MDKKLMVVILIVILGFYIQPILAQEVAQNLTATVNTFVGEEGNKELKGNLIITENEGIDKKINISFTNLIGENSSQVLDKSKINVTSAVLNKDLSKYTINVSGYGVWVGEISINTTGIESGTYNGKAIIEGSNSTPLGVDLSVMLSKPTWLKLVILLFAAGFIIFAVILILFVESPIRGTLLALIPVVAGTLLLYMFPLFDAQGNTVLTISFFIPLAAYIIDFLKGRRDDRLALEKSVTDTKSKAVEDAVDFHSALIEEINAHAATFSCMNGVGANPLDYDVWKEGKKKAGMVSDYPGYRLARYYQYVDIFNRYLEAMNKGQKSLKDPEKFYDFSREFHKLNEAYKELEEILFLNLFYNIGKLQYKFRSFKEIETPFRLPKHLETKLNKIIRDEKTKANKFHNLYQSLKAHLAKIVGSEREANEDKIYNEKVALALMKEIETDFKVHYEKLQNVLQKLSEIKIHDKSVSKDSNAKMTKAD